MEDNEGSRCPCSLTPVLLEFTHGLRPGRARRGEGASGSRCLLPAGPLGKGTAHRGNTYTLSIRMTERTSCRPQSGVFVGLQTMREPLKVQPSSWRALGDLKELSFKLDFSHVFELLQVRSGTRWGVQVGRYKGLNDLMIPGPLESSHAPTGLRKCFPLSSSPSSPGEGVVLAMDPRQTQKRP